jgi:hypothetical protein
VTFCVGGGCPLYSSQSLDQGQQHLGEVCHHQRPIDVVSTPGIPYRVVFLTTRPSHQVYAVVIKLESMTVVSLSTDSITVETVAIRFAHSLL